MHSKHYFILFLIVSTVVLGVLAYYVSSIFGWVLLGLTPIFLLGIQDMIQKGNSVRRNFPLLGRFRSLAHWMRPKIHQYFVESDLEGRPFNKLQREIIQQRSKKALSTNPFGTQKNVDQEGYEWVSHSINAKDHHEFEHNPKVRIGGKHCEKPYDCSLLNISAMSFGSLSKNAVMALNGGAAIGEFAHNTGEGGISPYHNAHNGDLIYQIGTGYFGCRAKDGGFDPDLFAERTAADNVKMIELKLSQGAKPGHGGILPAKKVSPEIAQIRNIEMGKDVLSPPYHKAFNTPIGLLEFIQQMRELSGGKPIGIKLCIGHRAEFVSICKAMIKTGITPDFIAVDGGEGGTGAAPLEFSNSVGMPFKEGIAYAYNTLEGFDLKKEIKLFGAGKIASGFHMFRALALGADVCYSARAMMMALGCIQALECNKNTCPVGVATQDPSLVKGLHVNDKKVKVANYHRETLTAFLELLGATGLNHHDEINRSHVYRRVNATETYRFDEVYPYVETGALLDESQIPESYAMDFKLSSAEKFLIHQPLTRLHL